MNSSTGHASPPPRFSWSSLALHLLLGALALLSLAPFAWLICASFKKQADFFTWTFLPWSNLSNLTLDNYRQLLSNPFQPFARWTLNSLFLASLQTACTVYCPGTKFATAV